MSVKARALPSPIGVGKARALLLVCPTDRKEVPIKFVHHRAIEKDAVSGQGGRAALVL